MLQSLDDSHDSAEGFACDHEVTYRLMEPRTSRKITRRSAASAGDRGDLDIGGPTSLVATLIIRFLMRSTVALLLSDRLIRTSDRHLYTRRLAHRRCPHPGGYLTYFDNSASSCLYAHPRVWARNLAPIGETNRTFQWE